MSTGKLTNRLFIHLPINPERLTPCALQPRTGPLSRGQKPALFPYHALHSLDLPWFPYMPALWASRTTSLPDGGTSIHPDSRSALHPSIHTFKRLTSCTPLAQNKASLWGTVVGFVPPVMLHIPQTCPGSPLKAQGTGRSTGLSTPPFAFLFLILSLLQTPPPPHHHISFFPQRFCLQL